ncbi:unnamed protein product [Bursaphelenchus okinawaensis]|uniref:Activin_recp domain-containing protein n=1 Tax=Bursaphelenchus okinawaensis TaxID=465554 RepID=A0A811L596_9BILA|nr:unnamed protein product [Bursaphelenchus okinawaensis]CAG9117845.1 unnamed protein product [Bursaphelenchus okinawaensis]
MLLFGPIAYKNALIWSNVCGKAGAKQKYFHEHFDRIKAIYQLYGYPKSTLRTFRPNIKAPLWTFGWNKDKMKCRIVKVWYFLVYFLLLSPLIDGLKCYQGTERLDNIEIGSASFECPVSAITCTKFVNYDSYTVSRGCHIDECFGTRRGMEFCRNYTQFGRNEQVCCCYGNNCNSGTNLRVSIFISTALLFLVGIVA